MVTFATEVTLGLILSKKNERQKKTDRQTKNDGRFDLWEPGFEMKQIDDKWITLSRQPKKSDKKFVELSDNSYITTK